MSVKIKKIANQTKPEGGQPEDRARPEVAPRPEDRARASAPDKKVFSGKARRPRRLDRSVCDVIFRRMSEGELLISIVKEPGMPARPTIYSWLEQDDALKKRFEAAREAQRDFFSEEIVLIADTVKRGSVTEKVGKRTVSDLATDRVAIAKLRITARSIARGKAYKTRDDDEDTQTFRVLNSPDLDGDGEA